MNSITPSQAVARMRTLTDLGITFSFSFMSYSSTIGKSNGIKRISKALLRKGYRVDQSSIAKQLIGYIDYTNVDANRTFHLPLLLSFNEYKIQP